MSAYPALRSNTSVCLSVVSDKVQALPPEGQVKFLKAIAAEILALLLVCIAIAGLLAMRRAKLGAAVQVPIHRHIPQPGRLAAVGLAAGALTVRRQDFRHVARVVKVFGEARPHHAYLFANARANRLKVLVHDGIGVWLAARRLHQGKFAWPQHQGGTLSLTRAQLDALVLGLPWQRIGEAGVITLL